MPAKIVMLNENKYFITQLKPSNRQMKTTILTNFGSTKMPKLKHKTIENEYLQNTKKTDFNTTKKRQQNYILTIYDKQLVIF